MGFRIANWPENKKPDQPASVPLTGLLCIHQQVNLTQGYHLPMASDQATVKGQLQGPVQTLAGLWSNLHPICRKILVRYERSAGGLRCGSLEHSSWKITEIPGSAAVSRATCLQQWIVHPFSSMLGTEPQNMGESPRSGKCHHKRWRPQRCEQSLQRNFIRRCKIYFGPLRKGEGVK